MKLRQPDVPAGDTERKWGLAAAAVVFIGSLGPWATNGITSMSGTSADGAITLAVGLAAGLLIAIDRWAFVVTLAGALTAVGCAATAIWIDEFFTVGFGNVSPGWGLLISIAGGAGIAAYGWRRLHPERYAAPS